jgi:syntaxin 5
MSDDRTAEFMTLAKSLGGTDGRASSLAKAAAATDAAAKTSSNPAHAALRSFHQTASGISKDIAATSALLSELTNLVRRQSSVFDDDATRTHQVNHLVGRIKGSIEGLNSRLDAAAVTIAQQKRRLGKNSQAGQEAFNIVQGLQTEFAEAASGFKTILDQRTDSMKQSGLLQQQVYGASTPDGEEDDDDDNPVPNLSLAPPPVFGSSSAEGGGMGLGGFPMLDLTSGMMPAGEATGPSYLPRPHGIASGGSGGGSYAGIRNRHASRDGDTSSMPTYSGAYSSFGGPGGPGDHNMETVPLTAFDMEQMEAANGQQSSMQLIPDQDYLQQRANAMSAVETNIVELGTIFNKLATMVAEHREMVQRVEDNVEDANVNINLSMNVLTDTLMSLRSNKRLALRLFSVLVVFILMFIIFFA